MDKKYIIIGTTSLNRIELHNDIFPEWIEWIHNIDFQYELLWFINIDIIKNLDDSYEDTVENYKDIVKNYNIKLNFLKNPDNSGNFLNACKRISENIVKYCDDNNINDNLIKIFWLEDDWKFNKNISININEILNNYSGNLTHINFSFIRNNYIWALAPSILSYKLWKTLHYSAWLNQKENIDPEHCIGLYYRNNFGNPDELYNITIIDKNINNKFLSEKFINYKNSYYTENNKNIIIEKHNNYIEKNKILEKFNDTILFIRITPGYCIDGCNYGRKFLEKKKIEKIGITKQNDGFYKIT